MKVKKRAPRLPGHLARSEASFTSCQSAGAATDTFTERPTSRCSNFDADSVYSQDHGARNLPRKEQFCGPTHDNLRPTLSPLLHSAIVHGVTPRARVKGAEKAPDAPYIKSVLGFHSVEPDASPTYWETGSSYSPARRMNAGPPIPGTHASHMRRPLNVRGGSSVGDRPPLFTLGDLVWYQHPSGPWIPGRVVGLELHAQMLHYAVVTVDDGVRRLALEEDLQLRTSSTQAPPSGTGEPAEIILSTSFERLQVSNSNSDTPGSIPSAEGTGTRSGNGLHRPGKFSPGHLNYNSTDSFNRLEVPLTEQSYEQDASQAVPYVRQSSDLDASGLERLRRFTAIEGPKALQPVEENETCARDQNTSCNGQSVRGDALPAQPSNSDPLSVPVWQNAYADTKPQQVDPLGPISSHASSLKHVSSSFLSPHSISAHSPMHQPSCHAGIGEPLFDPDATPSTLKSPPDTDLMLLSSRAFSPTGAIIDSALNSNSSSAALWASEQESQTASAPGHRRKPSGFGIDPLQNKNLSSLAHSDPLRCHISESSVEQPPQHGGSLFAPDMSVEAPPKALFTPNMVPQNTNQRGRDLGNDTVDEDVDNSELFTPCMSTPGTTLSSQAGSEGMPSFIPSVPSTGGRTLSGIFRTCVADTLGFGADPKRESSAREVAGTDQRSLGASSDELEFSLPQPPI